MNANKKLIELVFEKAKKESGLDVTNQLANYIANSIDEAFNFNISNRALRNYYNAVFKENEKEVNISSEIANHLARFINYRDYADFKSQNIVVKEKNSSQNNIHKKALIGGLFVIASYFGYDSMTNKCMIWVNNDRYEKTDCEEVNTIPIDDRLLDNFHRIEPDSTYAFFKEDGSPNLWYGKSVNGEYEYFNNFGIHPITGKTLKQVSNYMIKNHILKNKDK